MHTELFETYNENVIAIRMYANYFNDLKMVISINDKECSERPAAIEEDEL